MFILPLCRASTIKSYCTLVVPEYFYGNVFLKRVHLAFIFDFCDIALQVAGGEFRPRFGYLREWLSFPILVCRR